jgi:hypothetical protein
MSKDTSDEDFREFAAERLGRDPSAQFGETLSDWRRQRGTWVPLRDSLRETFDREQRRVAGRPASPRQEYEPRTTASWRKGLKSELANAPGEKTPTSWEAGPTSPGINGWIQWALDDYNWMIILGNAAILNFFWFFFESVWLGDAIQGFIRPDGVCLLGNHGVYREVPCAWWWWSRIHGISMILTLLPGALLLAVRRFAYGRN